MLYDNNGSILVVLIIIMPILLVIIGTIGHYAIFETYQTNHTKNKLKAYYIARSGADAISAYVLNGNDITSVMDETSDTINSIGNGLLNIEIVDAGNGIIKIISTASVNGISENVIVELEPGSSTNFSEFDKAIFSDDSISLTGGGTVNGDIGINSNSNNSIEIDGGPSINGDIYVGPEADTDNALSYPTWYQLQSNVYNLEEIVEYLLPEYPDFPEELPERGNYKAKWWPEPEPITSSGWYNNITVQSHLDIETNGQDIVIRANKLTCTGDGQINIIGSGKVYFYIEDDFKLNGSGSVNKNGDPEDVFMYYSGSKKLTFNGNNKLVGSLYAKDANLDLTGGGGVTGHMITGGDEVKINGGFYGYVKAILAPEAEIKLTGGGTINGSVVGKEIEMSGGATVNYDNSLNDNLPEEIVGGSSGDYVRVWK